jgi:hypothetical protein
MLWFVCLVFSGETRWMIIDLMYVCGWLDCLENLEKEVFLM